MLKPYDLVMATEDVNGYYIKRPCGIQMTVCIPKMKRGQVMEVGKIETAVRFIDIPQNIWVPNNKLQKVVA